MGLWLMDWIFRGGWLLVGLMNGWVLGIQNLWLGCYMGWVGLGWWDGWLTLYSCLDCLFCHYRMYVLESDIITLISFLAYLPDTIIPLFFPIHLETSPPISISSPAIYLHLTIQPAPFNHHHSTTNH